MKHPIHLLTAVAILTGLAGCTSNDDLPVSKDPQMIRLAAPIRVDYDSTVIELADYLQRPNQIDSLFADPDLKLTISPDSTRLVIKPLSRDFPKLSALTIWSKGFPNSLLLEKTTIQSFRFTWDPGNKKYKKVHLFGMMNDWNSSRGAMFLKDDKWHIDLSLFPGKYQYKLIVDGKMITDPNNNDSIVSGGGAGYNSIMTVGNLAPASLPYLYTSSQEGRTFTIGVKNQTDSVFVFWENQLLDHTFWSCDSAGIKVTVPRKAREFDRSYIRAWTFNKTGVSNQILVPLQKGKVVDDKKQLTRADQEAMIIYFLMVDRFRNGDKTNDHPVNDPEIDPKVNYFGGDLAGITRAIEDGYFTNLGINTIWISPITQNPLQGFVEYPAPHRKFSGYHGYWPITLSTIDHRFGDPNELNKMVSEAHDKGMNILLDFVSHHVHQDYAMLKTHPDWITSVDLPGKRKNIRLFDEERLTTWFDIFLPTFNLTIPEVTEMVSDSAAFWIKEYKIDGFRHDAAKHVPESYWRVLTKKLNKQVVIPESRNVYQIGETFGSRELIASYINPGMLDAQFEFNLYWDAKSAFSTDNFSFRDLNYSLQQSFITYGEHNLMGNITGNQDMPRFISFASGALSPGENAVEAGWNRDVQVKDTIGYRRLACLQAFNMTIPGIPVIYYGDEFGMAGAADPDNRRMMKFDSLSKQESNLLATTSALTRLRNSNLALSFGDFQTIKVTDRIYIYMRSYFDNAVFVIFNKDRSAKAIEFELPARFANSRLKPLMGSTPVVENGKVKVTLQGTSFEILSD